MTDNKKLGGRGENLAAKYFQDQGYQLIARNCRVGRREIDLIACRDEELVFIEVKTRIETPGSRQENPLTVRQVHNLKLAISEYCCQHHHNFEQLRLDLIIILIGQTDQQIRIRHYKNIF
jgi:putative endonuclease